MVVRPDYINIISLCTGGGGGLDLGIELAMPCARSVVLVEREAFACAHLVAAMQQGLMAPASLWSDVTTFNGRSWRGIVDGIIGGIPCQPHSLAGKRLGEDDERDLWSDARRIIVQTGAWFVLIENVRGIVSSGGGERIWRDFRRLGFEMEAGLFTAAEVGARLERERFFALAVSDHARCKGAERARQSDQARPERQAARRKPLRSTGGFGPPGPDQVSLIPRDPDAMAGRLLRHRNDALRMLGNGVVPLQAAYAFRTLAARLAASGSVGAAQLVWVMEGYS